MPRNYWYHCDRCDYRAKRYRNVRRCKCGGNLIREEPQTNPNRVVIEVYDDGAWSHIRAVRPNEVMIIRRYLSGGPDLVWGDGGLPVEPLGVERTAIGVLGRPAEVRFEAGASEEARE